MNENRQKELRSMVVKYGDPLSSLIEQSCDYIERMERQLSELKAENEALRQAIIEYDETDTASQSGRAMAKMLKLTQPSEGE